MAWESLADFFALHYGCNNRDIIKAVARCARGPYRESLHKAALAWRPLAGPAHAFHCALQQLMLMDEQPRMYGRIDLLRVTPNSTNVRKRLEKWLAEHSPLPPPNRALLPRPSAHQPQSKPKGWLEVEQENKQRYQAWLAKTKQENQHDG